MDDLDGWLEDIQRCGAESSIKSMPYRSIAAWLRELATARARIAELEAERDCALTFIEETGADILNRRIADWYPEGAHNSAVDMSESMRLIGNACADFLPENADGTV